jgi:hypothetical protein
VTACQQQVQCIHSAWVVANAAQPGAAGQTRTSKPQHNGNQNSDKKTTQNIQTTSTARSSQNGENKLYQTLLSPLPTGIPARRVLPRLLWPTLNPAMWSNVVLNGSSPQMATAQAPTTFPAIKSQPASLNTIPCLRVTTQRVSLNCWKPTTAALNPHGKTQRTVRSNGHMCCS